MKVTIEGTAEEILDLNELLALGRDSHRFQRRSKNINSTAREIPPGDDVPNRFREEGVQ